jgi:acetate kinase
MRRYGFHGISYEYIARQLRSIDPDTGGGRTIAAHLGNGASLCAMDGGRSIDTTMGFTALDGLVMGTRCGALDPGAVLYLFQQRGMTAREVEHLLYSESGLLGVSGVSSDMRALLGSETPAAGKRSSSSSGRSRARPALSRPRSGSRHIRVHCRDRREFA